MRSFNLCSMAPWTRRPPLLQVRRKSAFLPQRQTHTAPSPSILPHRFWNFHVPKETWDYRVRRGKYRDDVVRSHDRAVALRTWLRSIFDAKLPSPWSCNWALWPHWSTARPLEAELAVRYALSDRPLTVIVFNAFDKHSTVFACAASRKFYLYEKPYWAARERVSAFMGFFPTVEAFFEEADWNMLQEVCPETGDVDAELPSLVDLSPHKFPSIQIQNLRVAANEPYPKRTLWDMCPPKVVLVFNEFNPLIQSPSLGRIHAHPARLRPRAHALPGQCRLPPRLAAPPRHTPSRTVVLRVGGVLLLRRLVRRRGVDL
ncbi:hypothetical protein C8R46DRAFT_1188637 [Mycena filopes]|nr:hypothetical protein C8R46DRAFT_1188637 [Mycena filopes]